jgi:hypothetical protein
MPVDDMDADLLLRKIRRFETCALTGMGVFDTLRTITKLVLSDLKRKGIYQDEKAAAPKKKEQRAPVVSPRVEEGLVRTLETRTEPEARVEAAPGTQVPTRGLTFSDLWQPGATRDQVLVMEGEIERGDHQAAVQRAEGLLEEYVGASPGESGPTTAEALLMLGVHGGHYARFRDTLSKDTATKADALFCLFFLCDVELRIRAARMQVEE